MSDEEEVIPASETSIRWFGPTRPARHSWEGEYSMPQVVGRPCTGCGVQLQWGDQGWALRRLDDALQSSLFHADCLMKTLGLAQP